MDKDEQNRTLIIDPKPTLLLPPRQLIRRMIEAGLPTDAALSAFCLDCFPTIVRQFTAEMSRTRKLNLLIETIDETALSQALHHYLQAKNRPLLSSAPTQAQPQSVPKSHKRKRGKTRRSLDFVLRMKDVLLGGLLVGPLRKLSDWLSEIWMSLTGAVSALLAIMSKSTLALWGVLGFVGTGLVLKAVSDPNVLPIPPEYLLKPTRPESIRQTEGGHRLPPAVAYRTELTLPSMPIEDANIRLAPVRSLPNLSLDLSEVPRTPSVPAEGLTHSSPLPIIRPEPKRLRDVALKKKARPLLPPDFSRIPPLPDLPTGSHRKPDACKAAGTNPGRGTGC